MVLVLQGKVQGPFLFCYQYVWRKNVNYLHSNKNCGFRAIFVLIKIRKFLNYSSSFFEKTTFFPRFLLNPSVDIRSQKRSKTLEKILQGFWPFWDLISTPNCQGTICNHSYKDWHSRAALANTIARAASGPLLSPHFKKQNFQ